MEGAVGSPEDCRASSSTYPISSPSKRTASSLPSLPLTATNITTITAASTMKQDDLNLIAQKKQDLLHAAQEARKLSYSPYR